MTEPDWADEIATQMAFSVDDPRIRGKSVAFRADIAAALRKARTDALEEAAERIEEDDFCSCYSDGVDELYCDTCLAADAIRALKDKP